MNHRVDPDAGCLLERFRALHAVPQTVAGLLHGEKPYLLSRQREPQNDDEKGGGRNLSH